MRIAAGKTRFGAALAAALALHALLLVLPVHRPAPPAEPGPIELELTTIQPRLEAEPEPIVEPVTPTTLPPEPAPSLAEVTPPEPAPMPAGPEQRQPPARQARANTDVILSRQYISEEPVIDRLFGRPLETPAAPQVDFRIPQRTDMLTMLDRPMPDLPFDYTPGLVYFAYAPGLKGDLQRFWDVITPEFGWRTNSGTEVRCVLMLVVIGCGWK